MHYLLKITLKDTKLWRLIAIDGSESRSYIAQLMALAFDYKDDSRAFVVNENTYSAGFAGNGKNLHDLKSFDELNLNEGDNFTYICGDNGLIHDVNVMRKDEKLFCLIPSCLVGAGLYEQNLGYDPEIINTYLESDEAISLNLKEVTRRMRVFNIVKADANKELTSLGAQTFKFTMK